MVGFGGSKKENSNSAIFQDQEGSLTTSSSLYSSSLVIRLKGRMKEKKNTRMKSKGTIGRTNPFFFFSNTIPSPHRRSLDPLLPPFFYFDTAFARSHPIATLKITCVIFFCFTFVCNLEVHDNNSSVKHPIQDLDFFSFFASFCS